MAESEVRSKTGRELTVNVATRLPYTKYRKLVRIAIEEERSMSSLCRGILERWLDVRNAHGKARRVGDPQ